MHLGIIPKKFITLTFIICCSGFSPKVDLTEFEPMKNIPWF